MLCEDEGQASVELLGVLPALAAAGLVAWQLVLAGHAAWLSADAARVAARAKLVGADPARAARSALPRALEQGLEVERARGGATRVRVHVPLVHPAWRAPVSVSATASLAAAAP